MDDVFELILQLEEELNQAKGLFKKIDINKCLSIISNMKAAYPQIISDADYIIEHNKELVLDAERRAKQIITDAERLVENATRESEIVKRAEQLAARHMENTRIQCDATINKAASIIYDMFTDAEGYLSNLLNILRRNKDELLGSLQQNQN